jgi:protein-tyrosine phosphatase
MLRNALYRALSALLILALSSAPPLAAQPASPRTQVTVKTAHQRVLPLEGGQNFRDLGGYRTTNGRTVRWGLLFRSGSMHYLTAADFAYLETLQIRTVCDLRSTSERKIEPVAWPAGETPRIFADDYKMDTALPPTIKTGEQARAIMAAMYPRFLEQFNGQYRRMFAELLAGHAPLAFNCSAGKDRTGVAAALLLSALGVPRETVIQDYQLTNRYLDQTKLGFLDKESLAKWQSLPPRVMKALNAADRSYIETMFRELDSYAGGMRSYMRDKLELSEIDLAKLRRMYTE